MSTPIPKGLEITQASYGTENAMQDVTKEARKLIKDDSISFTVSAQSLGILDPAPGVKKTFQANISINGGPPVLMTKDDKEQFVMSAPTVKTDDKDEKSDLGQAGVTVFYFFIALVGSYLAYSFYQLGSYGFSSGMVGLVLAVLVAGSYLASANSRTSASIAGLLGSTMTALILPVLIIVGYAFFGGRVDWTFGKIATPE